jgi:signal peptide peptidase SppA
MNAMSAEPSALRRALRLIPLKRFRDPAPVVPVVRLSGVIGAMGGFRRRLSIAAAAPLLKRAFAVPDAPCVALVINSPGGSPVQSDLIARRIRALAEENETPVVAFCEDVAASGGYWLALAADEVFAARSSIVGSIGVVSAGFGFEGLIEKLGVERRLHTAGEKKGLLDPFQPERAEDLDHLKTIQTAIHDDFKAWVRERRGERLTADEDEAFSGAFWTGARAAEMGLIDGLGDIRQVMRERFGERVRLKVVSPRRSLFGPGAGLGAGLGAGFGADRAAGPSVLPGAWADDLIAAAEDRLMWTRFGL